MSSFQISIIIVNYNVKSYLEQLLYSLRNATAGLSVEIIIVDNHSTDGSVEFLEREFRDRVILIKNESNVGFGRANNQGLAVAQGDYVLLLNPDTLVEEDTLHRMKSFMDQNSEAGAIGCKILNPDGTIQLACRRGFPSPLSAFFKIIGLSGLFPKSRLFSTYNMTYVDENQIHPVDAISGSFMFIRKSVLDRVGYFDEEFFMYGEDLDLCYRLNKISRIYYVPTTQIIHFKGESSRQAAWKSKIEFYRSMVIFVRKNLHSHWLGYLKPLIIACIFVNGLLNMLLGIVKRNSVPLMDLAAVNLSFLLAVIIRFDRFIPLPPCDNVGSYPLIMGINSLFYLLVFYLFDVYQGRYRFFLPRVIMASAIAGGLVTLFTFFIKLIAFSRLVMLIDLGLVFLILIGWRLLVSRFVNVRVGYLSQRRTFFVGYNEKLQELFNPSQNLYYLEYEMVGIISSDSAAIGRLVHGIPIVGEIRCLADLIDRYRIADLLIGTDFFSYHQLLNLMTSLKNKGVEIRLISLQSDWIFGRTPDDGIPSSTLLNVRPEPPLLSFNSGIKRMFDVTVGVILLIIGFFPFIVLWMRCKFKLDKREFTWYNSILRLYEIPDSRISSRWLRWIKYYAYLVPVIRGKMSLVGLDPRDMHRFSYLRLKPGLLTIHSVLRYNFPATLDRTILYHYYYQHLNLFFDLEILLRSRLESRKSHT